LKNQNCWRGSLRASLLFAIAILMFAAPLHAGGPPSNNATQTRKQALWMTDALGFSELKGNQALIAFGNPPSVPGAVTFDSNGNFWGTFCEGPGQNALGLIFELTQKQLLKLKSGGGLNAATVQLEDPYPLFDCPRSLEFDKAGNLWVANSGTSFDDPSIMKYSAYQLTTGGKLYPATVFTSSMFRYIWDIKFDASGNLWIAADGPFGVGPDAVFELTSEQLAQPGAPYFPVAVTPNLELTSKTFAFPGGIAFDHSGNLWVGGYTTPLLAFAASDLSGSGTISPAPFVTIDPTTVKKINSSFYVTSGIAFDGQGNLWMSSGQSDGDAKNDNGTIAEFKPGQITSSGNPKPALFLLISHILRHPGPLTFGPQF
jgi:sugar lactone lactonase YvrE